MFHLFLNIWAVFYCIYKNTQFVLSEIIIYKKKIHGHSIVQKKKTHES